MSLPVWKSFKARRFVSCTRHGNVQRNALTQSLGLQNGVWYAESSQIADLSRLQSTNRNGKLQCKTMQNCWILVFVGWGQWEVSHLRWHTQMSLGDTVLLQPRFMLCSILQPLGLKLKEPRLKLEKALRTIGIHWVSRCLYFEIWVDILRWTTPVSTRIHE